jgi:hypothetical protein
MPIVSGGAVVSGSSQIVDGAILNADINASAAIARSKLDFGSGLVDADIASGAAIALSKLATDPLARANHTGTQLASTISNFSAAVLALVSSAWTTLVKSADESRASNTTLTADSTLTFAMSANKTYFIRAMIAYYSTSGTPDLKFDFTGPATPVSVIGQGSKTAINDGVLTSFVFNTYAGTALTITGTDNSALGYLKVEMMVRNGANAGTFAFRWAQNTSDPTNTTIVAGSMLEYIEK